METINKAVILQLIFDKDYTLKSSHKKLCLPIISRIYKKMLHGIKFDDIKVCETTIIDGHHRSVSALLTLIK